MFSNWSTLLFVLPFLTSRRVLYLSLPCFTFSLWILSIVVSALKGQSHIQIHKHTCKYGQKLNEKPNYLYLIISGVGEVFLQASQLALQSFILLSKGETLLRDCDKKVFKGRAFYTLIWNIIAAPVKVNLLCHPAADWNKWALSLLWYWKLFIKIKIDLLNLTLKFLDGKRALI